MQKALMKSAVFVTVCSIAEGLAGVNDIGFILNVQPKQKNNQYQFPSSPGSTRGPIYFNILKYSLNAAVAVSVVERLFEGIFMKVMSCRKKRFEDSF